jgi:DNA-binding transcriptional ArsR family regulator
MVNRINPYKMFHGSFIPEWLEERPIKEISIGAKLIYARLTRYAGKYGDCFPKLEKISESTGVSVSQVQRYIKELKKIGLIESSRLGKKCSNRYFFLEHKWMLEAIYVECDRSNMTNNEKSDRSDMTTPMDRSDMTTPQKENQERESNISSSFRWKEFSAPFETKSKTGECDQKLNKMSEAEYFLLLTKRDEYILYIKNKRKSWSGYPMKNAVTFLTPKYWKNAEWKIEEGAPVGSYIQSNQNYQSSPTEYSI